MNKRHKPIFCNCKKRAEPVEQVSKAYEMHWYKFVAANVKRIQAETKMYNYLERLGTKRKKAIPHIRLLHGPEIQMMKEIKKAQKEKRKP